jgi:hypothetical protein
MVTQQVTVIWFLGRDFTLQTSQPYNEWFSITGFTWETDLPIKPVSALEQSYANSFFVDSLGICCCVNAWFIVKVRLKGMMDCLM